MRTIELVVPDERCTDAWWERCTPVQRADALDAISNIIVSVSNDSTDTGKEILALKQRLAGATDATHAAAKAVGDHLETVWTRRLDEKERVIELLRAQCDSFRNLAEQTKSACEAQQQMVNSMRQQATPPCTAQQLGGIAELEVEQLIVETLVCDVKDVSHETGRGDRHVSSSDGLELMVEIKNVERLHSKNDIEKFRRDVYEGVTAQRINAALMISLKSSSIPNVGGACSVQFMQSDRGRIPVIMVATNSRIAIQLALRAISQLQLIAEKEMRANGATVPAQLEVLENERVQVQKLLPNLLKFVHDSDHYVESRIEMLQRLLDDALNERARVKESLYMSVRLQQAISWVEATQGETDTDLAVSILLKWFARKGEFPKTSELTMSQRTAVKNAGGMKSVVDIAKKRQREEGDRDATTAQL